MENSFSIDQFVSGIWEQQYAYQSFLPNPINREWLVRAPDIVGLLSEADRLVGELNAYGNLVPDVDFFIKMHITKEATYSNRIEGTQTAVGEAVMERSDIDPEKRDDWEEVQHYINAIHFAIAELEHLPLSTRLLKKTHAVLLDGVRGKHKMPGEYRTSQNWIGGATLRDAVFVPPSHIHINDLMSDLEKFMNNVDIHTPHLIRIAIAHYQFETIHPFLDGNGRLGRLLITLYLVRYGLLSRPSLYLSDFLEKNKAHYYDNLTAVRTRNDLQQWIRFFLVGVIETAKSAISTFQAILGLKAAAEEKVMAALGKRAPLALNFLKVLYTKPVTTPADAAQRLGVSNATAHRLVADFVRLGILIEHTNFRRNRLFVFREYLALFEERT